MPDDYRIRVATPEDAAAVGELLAACYPVLMRDSYEPAVLAAALPMMTRAHPGLLASGTYHVAEAPDGRLVGCGGWTPERPDIGAIEPGVAHIRHFATHPDWIGRGVGRAICDRCISEARNFGASRLECFSSLNAEGFYAALGFAAVRRVEVPMSPGITFPGVLMAREV